MPNGKPAMVAAGAALALFSGCTRRMAAKDEAWHELVGEHRRDVDVGAFSLHCIDMGAGEPVVMIHGVADSTYSWHRNAKALVDAGFRVILVDQPGFGYSAIPPKGWIYSVENQAEAILKLIDGIGVERFHVVGHSLGGGEALYLAWKHPQRIRRAAVLAPACERTSCPFGLGTDLVAWAFGTRWLTARALRSAFYRPERVGDAEIDEYSRLLDRPGRMGRGVLGGVCRDYFSAEYDRMTAAYEHLEPELLIVWGERDTWHPVAFGTRLQARAPRSHLVVIPEAGHNAQQERPEVVNPLLVRFLRGDSREDDGPRR